MSYLYQPLAPANMYKVVDGKNSFWGILGNADIAGCTLYHHNIAAICRSSSTDEILLHKALSGNFDFPIWGTVTYDKSCEASIEEQASAILGEKPVDIKFIGISSPNDTKSNFVSYYEIYYTEKFIRNVICAGDLTLLGIDEFQNLCFYFPEDVAPLLRESAHAIYGFSQRRIS